MLLRVAVSVLLTACFGLPVLAQQAPPSSESSVQTATPEPQNKNSVQGQQPSSEQPSNEDNKKKESKIKRKAKDLIPGCVGIAGGAGKCRHSEDEEEQRKREEQEDQLRRQCREAAQLSQQESQSCADLRKSDAAHDLEVGDTYFDQKSYTAAASRYRSALEGDPTNAMAILHYAQALEKLGRKSEAYEQYQRYLNTEPQGADADRARKAVERLHSSASLSK